MSQTGFAMIDAVTELFKLKEVRPNLYLGLLYPRSNDGPFSYGRPALSVEIKVTDSLSPGLFEFFACIRSIDDSGVSVFGPPETKEKAEWRMREFRDFILLQEYSCPSTEALKLACQKMGVFPNYW